VAYALAMDHFAREISPKIGGLDDYVNLLQTEEIKVLISEYLDRYPELNNINKVEELMKMYGIEFMD